MVSAPPSALPEGPITLIPQFVERIWGTDALDPYFPAPSPGRKIGEAWLTAEECHIEGTDLTLGELAQSDPALAAGGHGFPLLIKLLFPREKLSVQVHPDDAYAQASLGQPRGKTECWYILSAEPGAQVAVGFREQITPAAMQAAIADGTIESHLRMIPVKAGDMIFIDAGTVHAIGPGMVLLETQQYSDVTYRLWDYGRPRELHVEAGLAVTRSETAAGLMKPVGMGAFDRLVNCPYFTVDRFQLQPGALVNLGKSAQLQILVALGSSAQLLTPDASRSLPAESWSLPMAEAVLLPVSTTQYTLQCDEASEVLRITGAPQPS